MSAVAIIGAGITGLTAAHRLRREGIAVTIYEAASRPGGPIQTVQRNGFLAECGPNSILETSPVIADLVKDLGLESERVYGNPAAKNRYLVRGGRMLAAPSSVATFLKTPLFSWPAKLRLGLEPLIARSTDEDESLGSFVRRRLGREFLDYAINPFVGGIYAGDPEALSVKQAFPKLNAVEERYGSLILGQFLGARERQRKKEVSKQRAPMFSFKEGLETLPRALAVELKDALRLSAPVRSIRATDMGWEVRTDTTCEEHSAVLLAIGAHQLAKFFPILAPLQEVKYPPVASVTLGFKRIEVKAPLDGFGVLVPQVEKMSILGTIFTSSLFANRAPDRHVTLTSYVGGSRAPHLARLPRSEIVSLVKADLRQLLGVEGEAVFENVHIFPEAIPQYNVGYGSFKHLMAEAEAAAPGVFIAGQARCGISLGDSIVSGHKAAERIENHLCRGDHRLGEDRLAHFQPT
jgi:protoporphyrinogen/coproporphyrinogen III oxidase